MDRITTLTDKELLQLRSEVTLGSVFFSDYSNSFGIPENEAMSFFEGFLDYCDELIQEKLGDIEDYNFWEEFEDYDNLEYLKRYIMVYC